MSTQAESRIELNVALCLLAVAGASLASMTAVSQIPDAVQSARTVGGLSPTELLAFVALLALGLCGFVRHEGRVWWVQ